MPRSRCKKVVSELLRLELASNKLISNLAPRTKRNLPQICSLCLGCGLVLAAVAVTAPVVSTTHRLKNGAVDVIAVEVDSWTLILCPISSDATDPQRLHSQTLRGASFH